LFVITLFFFSFCVCSACLFAHLTRQLIDGIEFTKRALIFGIERQAYERELVSKLLSACYELFNDNEIEDGFQLLLFRLPDLVLDVPHGPSLLSKVSCDADVLLLVKRGFVFVFCVCICLFFFFFWVCLVCLLVFVMDSLSVLVSLHICPKFQFFLFMPVCRFLSHVRSSLRAPSTTRLCRRSSSRKLTWTTSKRRNACR
jgi:hypothetical protein